MGFSDAQVRQLKAKLDGRLIFHKAEVQIDPLNPPITNVNGVLESTMFNIIAFKTLNPAFDSDKVVEKIREVAIDNDSHVIRYKALLTLSYLTDQESFDVTSQLMPLIKSNDANGAFRVLVDSIQEKQIVESRSQK